MLNQEITKVTITGLVAIELDIIENHETRQRNARYGLKRAAVRHAHQGGRVAGNHPLLPLGRQGRDPARTFLSRNWWNLT